MGLGRIRSGALALGLVAVASGCAGTRTSPESASPSSDVDASASAATPSTAALPPLEPAPAPRGLVLRARVAGVGPLADEVLEGMDVPFDWRQAMQQGSREGSLLVQAIDWSAPSEAMLMLNPQPQEPPYAAFSLGSPGVDKTLAALDRFQIDAQEGPGGLFYFAHKDLSCALGRSLGPSPARVVCSEREESLARLLDYALRGLPTQKLSDSYAHFDIDMKPVRAAYGKQARNLKMLASVAARRAQLGPPRFDRAINDLFVGLAEEASDVLRDADSMVGKLQATERGYELSLQVKMTGNSSWVSKAIADYASKQATAPDVFGTLPRASTSAGYTRHLPDARTEEMSKTLQDLLGGFMEHEGLSQVAVSRAESLIDEYFRDSGPTVSATGPLVSEKIDGETRLATAWNLWGTKRSRRAVVGVFDDLAGLLSDPDIKKELDDDDALPKLTRKYRVVRGVPGAAVYHWEWPGVLDDELSTLGGFAGPEGPLSPGRLSWLKSGYFAIVERGGVTWIANAQNLENAAEPLRALAARSSERLEGDTTLSPVFDRPAVAAGFARVEGILAVGAPWFPESMARGWDAMLQATPNQGQVPAFYFVEASTSRANVMQLTQVLPKETLSDLLALVVAAVAER